MIDHPAPGHKMPEGGTEFATEDLTCVRCGQLATRSYSGNEDRGGYIELCEGCHDDLGAWLNGEESR